MANFWQSDRARYLAPIVCTLAVLACQTTPLSTPAFRHSPSSVQNGRACFDFRDLGITCLEAGGWQNYAENEFSPLRYISRMDACADGQIVVVGILNLAIWDGRTWSEMDYNISQPEAIACTSSDNIWVAHYQGVSHFDGRTWTEFLSERLGSGEYVDSVRDVAIGPDGLIWVVTAESIARYDGREWIVFEQGRGWDKHHYLWAIAVGAQGKPTAAYDSGLLTFDGETWTEHERGYIGPKDVLVDSEGRIWVAAYSGLEAFDGDLWKTYTTRNSDLSSDHIEALALDGRGRLWVGTTWGLNVLDGQGWTAYHMHSSDLLDNQVNSLFVTGLGPPLPEPVDRRYGAIVGQGESNRRVEACAEIPDMLYFYLEETPCQNQPFVRGTITDEEGRFTIAGLPVGRYYVTWQVDEDTWSVLDERVLVESGQQTHVTLR